jgi:hypothetical protein
MLFTFAGGTGHVEPLVPLAVAARAAGHVVAFAGRPSAAADGRGPRLHGLPDRAPRRAPADRVPLRPLSAERADRELRDGFAGRLARQRSERLLPLCLSWRPDVVVADETDFGALVVAELLRLPTPPWP